MRPGDYHNRHQGPQSPAGRAIALLLTLAVILLVALNAAGVLA